MLHFSNISAVTAVILKNKTFSKILQNSFTFSNYMKRKSYKVTNDHKGTVMDSFLCKKFHRLCLTVSYPAGNYIFEVNNRNTRTRCEICSKLTITTVNGVVLVSLLFTLNIFHTLFWCFYC